VSKQGGEESGPVTDVFCRLSPSISGEKCLTPACLSQASALYNRVRELQSLQDILASPPTNVIVLLGPPSCGKSGALACPRVFAPACES